MTTRASTDEIRGRHRLIAHWNQALLADGSLTIVGDGLLARLVALGAAALGIGTGEGCITVIAPPRRPDGIFCDAADGDDALGGLLRAVTSRYPDCALCSVPFRPGDSQTKLLAIPSGVVVSCPSNRADLIAASQLARRWGAELISAVTGGRSLFISTNPIVTHLGQLCFKRGDRECGGSTAVAMLAAGLVLGEVRRLLMPMPGDTPTHGLTIEAAHLGAPPPRRILMVGAGASASAAAVGMVTLLGAGSSLAVWDGDRVEASNQSRSWFFDQPGEPKAVALARGLEHLAPGAQVSPTAANVGSDVLHLEPECEVVLLNTDNWNSRAEVDRALAEAGGRVAFNVGTSPSGAAVHAMGGGAACLHCRRPDLEELAAQERERAERPHSCANQPQGSHIITNMIGGGLQARMLERYLCANEVDGHVVTYAADDPDRLIYRSPQNCACYRRNADP